MTKEPTARPNLFIVGAMKSGTTSLHAYLDSHPDIYMSEEKEPGYFVPEINGTRTEDEYLSLFAPGAGCRFRGESSTHYTKLPTYAGVPERIRQFAPEARIIYIMRNPIERTISHYWHAVRDIHLGRERLTAIDAIRKRVEYTAYSNYAMQLQAFLTAFPREHVYCLTLESLQSDPNSELTRLYAWLGVGAAVLPEPERHNAAPHSTRKVAGLGVLNAIRYSRWWSRIAELVPKHLRTFATRHAYSAVEPRLAPEERATVERVLLQEFHYEDRVRELEQLLSRKFPEWDLQAGQTQRSG